MDRQKRQTQDVNSEKGGEKDKGYQLNYGRQKTRERNAPSNPYPFEDGGKEGFGIFFKVP